MLANGGVGGGGGGGGVGGHMSHVETHHASIVFATGGRAAPCCLQAWRQRGSMKPMKMYRIILKYEGNRGYLMESQNQ